jgi:hypothetical protein
MREAPPVPVNKSSRCHSGLSVLAIFGISVLLATSCTGAGQTTENVGACMPEDPVLEPESVAPGEELRVTSAGLNTRAKCDPQENEGAQYRIRVKSMDAAGRVEFTGLANTDSGGLDEVVVIPDDFPEGVATVDLLVDDPAVFCELNESVECGRSVARLLVVGQR